MPIKGNAFIDITHSELPAKAQAQAQAQTSVTDYKCVFLCEAVSQVSDF